MSGVLIFIFGLSVGSFLNVVIYRLKKGGPVIVGRSCCPYCRTVLKWYDLIPLVSFVLVSGKCRYCSKKISFQYPLVELATGLLFLIIFFFDFAQNKNSIDLVYYLIIVSSLIIVFVYDLKHYLIPDKIVFPAIGLAFIFRLFEGSVLDSLLAGLSAGGFFLLLVLVSKGKWMGLGDVKLALLMGLILGWPGIFIALFLSFFSGAVVGLSLIALGKKKMKSEIPFGPFLVGSTVFVIFTNQYLTDYLNGYFVGL